MKGDLDPKTRRGHRSETRQPVRHVSRTSKTSYFLAVVFRALRGWAGVGSVPLLDELAEPDTRGCAILNGCLRHSAAQPVIDHSSWLA